MGRLSEIIKSAAPKRRKLAGLERRWLVNNVSVMVVLAALRRGAFDYFAQTPHLYPKPQTVVI